MTLAVEPGGAAYFTSNSTPKGLGIGGRLSIPVIGGFEFAAGHTFVNCKSTAAPMNTQHAYGAVAYRLDDFRRFSPWFEGGLGFFGFFFDARGHAPLFDIALHVGAGLDVSWRALLLGVFMRYEIYLLSGLTNFPAAITAGLRLGVKIPF